MPASTYQYPNYAAATTDLTMSSTAFRTQVTQFLSDATRCYELCDAILTNRRLGSKHESFDRLQDGLRSSASEIQSQYNQLRKQIGSKMDSGDDKALAAIEASIQDVQMDIRAKLYDIAYKRNGRDSPETPGFRDLLRRWRTIEQDVLDTMQRLGQRMDGKSDHKKHEKRATFKKSYAVKSADNYAKPADTYADQTQSEEVQIRLEDLNTMLNHMKNCWVEKWVGGQILYVNKFDASNTQWERPSGYIKPLKSSSRTGSTSSRDSRRSSVEDYDVPSKRKSSRY